MNILLIISVLFLLVYTALIILYSIRWPKNSFMPKAGFTGSDKTNTHFSIIIAARNEEKHIGCLLQAIQNQTYTSGKYEVIVVDDYSTDGTASIVQQFAFAKLIKLKDIEGTQQLNSYKKKALETGIAQSKGEWIVCTDADCKVPPQWLETIAAFIEEKKPQMIIMPVAIQCSSRPIEIFQALDFMTLQGITATMLHHMCNGANLAYTKKAFDAVNGFDGIDEVASGDDMLLMHKIARSFPGEIQYLKSTNVIVQTAPVKDVKEFFQQRIRWASKTGQYKEKGIWLSMLLVYLVNVLLLAFPVVALGTGNILYVKPWLALLVAKTGVEFVFLFPVAGFFNQKKLLWLFPLAQPFHIAYIVIAGWLGKFGSYNWKGRTVK